MCLPPCLVYTVVKNGYQNISAFSNGIRHISQMSYKVIMGQNPGDKGPIYLTLIVILLYLYFQLATASKYRFFLHVYFDMWPLGNICSIKIVFLKKHFRLFSFLSNSSAFSFSYVQNKTTHCHASNYFLFATT